MSAAAMGVRSDRRGIDAPWTVAIVALAIVATVAVTQAHALTGMVAVRDSVARGELWRLFTGTLVHSNLGQLGRDVVAFGILGVAYEPHFGKRWPLLLLPSLILPVAAYFIAEPNMPAYFGLSGAVYALIAIAFVVEWRESGGRPPMWILGFCAVTLIKLVYETITGRLLIPMELGHGVVPAPVAHIAGLVVGFAATVMPCAPFSRPAGSISSS